MRMTAWEILMTPPGWPSVPWARARVGMVRPIRP